MDNKVDNVTVYKLIKKLSTPFTKWRAYKHGIIDAKGNILKKDLSNRNEKDSFTKLDVLALNLKNEIAKMPGGNSKLASYAAALYLVKEHTSLDDVSLNESDINNIKDYVSQLDEELAANHTSSSAIAGLGTDSMTPKLHKEPMRRHKINTLKSKEKLKDER